MLESFCFRVSVECHTCRIANPLNGIVESLRCYHCGDVNTYDAAFWPRALGSLFGSAFQLAPKTAGESIMPFGGLRVEYARVAPFCQRCTGPAVDTSGLAGYAEHGACACAACGAPIPVRRADALALAVNTGARFLVNEQAPGAAGQALQARAKPVVFACMSCGASLHVDGSSRMVSCTYCSADNYLPDGLWQMLNPVPKPEWFFVLCEYETVAERAARVPQATPEQLTSLAADAAPEVRRAVAMNPRTPLPVLHKLAFDSDRTVLEGLAWNPNLPPDIIAEMAESNDPEFRALAMRHPGYVPSYVTTTKKGFFGKLFS